MSRGFVKEGDQEEIPLVTPRAHLPNGVANYVTPNGLQELKKELEGMINERKELQLQNIENNRVQINYITAKMRLLEERISSAKIVDLNKQNKNEIHFGAKITIYKKQEKCKCQYQIVGVDEANVSQNKVSFLSPIAKVLINKKVGDKITLKTPKGDKDMTIESIDY